MQQRGQPCPAGRLEPDPLPVELALQHRELVPQGEDLRILVTVTARVAEHPLNSTDVLFGRHNAQPVRMAHEAVCRGDLGRLVFATWRFGGEAGTSAHPHVNLIETQCHGLDMLEHLCGPVDSVMAEMTDVTGRGWST